MLQEVVDLITEKELRLRTPLEELDLLVAGSKPVDDSELKTVNDNDLSE